MDGEIQFLSTHYVSERNTQFSFIAIVPSWLRALSIQIIESAKGYASRFGASSRRFGFIQHGSPNECTSYIYCTGPNVQQTAWDLRFKVPVGGFRFGDMDPLTGEPFPGGVNKRGSYIALVDKPEYEGQEVKFVTRTYTKYSGQTITKLGFFSRSLRKNIGEGVMLSEIGERNLKMLALGIGMQMAHAIGNQIKFECARQGISCLVQGPSVITTIT